MSRAQRMGLAAVVALAGCLEPELTPCGDLLCGEGTVCVDNVVCAAPDQLEACAGIAEEAPCQSSNGPGHCVSGVCVPNICGDGRVTGVEACDGMDLSATCADFGYYEGTLSCTASCVPDPSGCAAFCGDGIVQTDYDEQCDTEPPSEGCIAFGHDYGVLTCNDFCAPAINRDCRRYGWEQLLPPTTELYTGAATNAHGAIGITPSTIDVVWDGVTSTRANPGWTWAVASANAFAVVGPSSIGWFDGQWHELAFGLNPTWVSLADDGQLFARTGAPCAITSVKLATGAMGSITSLPSTCLGGVALAADELYASQGVSGIARWSGSSWSTISTVTATVITPAGDRRLAAIASESVRMVDVSVTPGLASPARPGGVGDAVFFDNDGNELDGAYPEDEPQVSLRLWGALFSLDDARTLPYVTRGADGRLVRFGSGVHAMRPVTVATALPIDTEINMLHRAEDGLIACGNRIYVTGAFGFAQRPFPNNVGACIEAAGHAVGAHYVLTPSGVYFYNAGMNQYNAVLGTTGLSSIAGDVSKLWIAGGLTMVSITNGGSPVGASPPSGCRILKLAMSPSRTFIGTGVCADKLTVFEYTTAWTVRASSTLDATNVATDHAIAVGDDESIFIRFREDVYRLDDTTFTHVGTGLAIDAIGANDFFIDQGGETMMHHVLAPPARELRLVSGPFAATPSHLFSWDRVSRRFYGLARMTFAPDSP